MRSGERCDKCGIGKMKTQTTRTQGSFRVRHLKCSNLDCDSRGYETFQIDDLRRPIYHPTTRTIQTSHLLPPCDN